MTKPEPGAPWTSWVSKTQPAGRATPVSERLERYTEWCLEHEQYILGIEVLKHFEALSPFAQGIGTLLWDLGLIDVYQVRHPMAQGEGFVIYQIALRDLCNIHAVQALGQAMEAEGILTTHLNVKQPEHTVVVFHPKVIG